MGFSELETSNVDSGSHSVAPSQAEVGLRFTIALFLFAIG